MVFIYALIDPFTFKVRYIGKTINLKQRFNRQMVERSNTHRCNWIIWRCHLCPTYERRFNAVTGEMKVKGKTGIPHTGSSNGRGDVGALVENVCEN